MGLITDGTDELKIPAGKTPKGVDLVIVPTSTGMYRIKYSGVGNPPKVCEELFTALPLAKRAVERYRRTNAAEYSKEALKNKIASEPSHKEQRKQLAKSLKNGEMSVEKTDEE